VTDALHFHVCTCGHSWSCTRPACPDTPKATGRTRVPDTCRPCRSKLAAKYADPARFPPAPGVSERPAPHTHAPGRPDAPTGL